MTVKELIEYLKQFPEDFEVTIWHEVHQMEEDLEKEDIYSSTLHKEVSLVKR